jgi:uncharacterized membrane protein
MHDRSDSFSPLMEVFVVLIAALFHALWNGMMKKSSDKLASMAMIRSVGIVYGIIAVWQHPVLNPEALPWLFAATGFHYLYFYALTRSYQYGEFSVVYPISRGLAPILVLVYSMAFLSGELTLGSILGTSVIALAVLILTSGTHASQRKPIIFALLTAFSIAGYTLTAGMGIRRSDSFFAFSGWLEIMMSSGLILFTVAKRRSALGGIIRREYKAGIIAGLLSVSAYAAALWAMTGSAIAPIAALRESSVIFATLVAVIFLKEKFSFQRLLASFLLVVGVFFITAV